VPKGTSHVHFHYEPRTFSVGIALAVAGLAALGAIWLLSGWRGRRRPHAKTPDLSASGHHA